MTAASGVSDLYLALRQVKFENKAFWRNPPAAFFTFIFPLMFLAIFNLAFGSQEVRVSGRMVNLSTLFIIPGITALSIISACYTNIAISVSFARDQGILKRTRGTPLPAWAYMFGRIGHALIVALILVAIVLLAGALLYDVDLPIDKMAAFIVTLLAGAACFCSLGLAITTVIPNADASPAIVNASILPLLFISDVFIPSRNFPPWLKTVADIFPVKHFQDALATSFNPFATGSGFRWGDLAVIAIWGMAGLVVASRFFSWEPRR